MPRLTSNHRRCLLALVLLGSALLPHPALAEGTVVVLHGLARSAGSMGKMELALQAKGFRTCNIDYPSTKYPIEELTARFVIPAVAECAPHGTVHFVTHSMGGIIVRQIASVAPEVSVGRVVMLGPPNKGSEIVDAMEYFSPFYWLNGPAGLQLGTGEDSVPNQLGPASFEVGVIAGDAPFMEPFKGFIPGPNDGKVAVERARLDGMTDFLVLPVTHSLMMRDQQVIDYTLRFLDRGKFDPVGAQVAGAAAR
jgi:pimeloyl-ACP methyl ester carboxylesterase